jgi:DNA-directed RNA polymerase specialized sigma24 family protein
MALEDMRRAVQLLPEAQREVIILRFASASRLPIRRKR